MLAKVAGFLLAPAAGALVTKLVTGQQDTLDKAAYKGAAVNAALAAAALLGGSKLGGSKLGDAGRAVAHGALYGSGVAAAALAAYPTVANTSFGRKSPKVDAVAFLLTGDTKTASARWNLNSAPAMTAGALPTMTGLEPLTEAELTGMAQAMKG